MNARPSTTVTAPRIRVSTVACRWSSAPKPPKASPALTNTTVNPSTNRATPSSSRPRRCAARSAPVIPVT